MYFLNNPKHFANNLCMKLYRKIIISILAKRIMLITTMKANKEQINILKHFFLKKIWSDDIEQYSKIQKLYYKTLRCSVSTIHRYIEDKCMIKASALTYFTLMSMVPLLALILGIARGFGLGVILENELKTNVLSMGSGVEKIFEFSKNMIENAKGGVFTGLGLVILFYAVIKGLGNIEQSFNGIWGVKKKRTIARQFSDYLSVMMILPLFFVSLSGINVFIVATMKNLGAEYSLFGTISPYLLKIMKLIPYVIVWIFFVFLYVFIPNTKVKLKPALISGILIGTLVQLVQWIYIKFQVGVSSYNAIYGTFAAIPLLLIWLQLTWSLVLMGAQMCFYIQHSDDIEGITDEETLASNSTRVLLLVIMNRICTLFKDRQVGESMSELSNTINVRYSDMKKGLEILLGCGLILEVSQDESQVYIPAFDINIMTIGLIYNSIDRYGVDKDYDFKNQPKGYLSKMIKNYEEIISRELGNTLVTDISTSE